MVLMENEQSEMEMSIAGMDSQIHKSQSKLIEIDVAKATQVHNIEVLLEKKSDMKLRLELVSSIKAGSMLVPIQPRPTYHKKLYQ